MNNKAKSLLFPYNDDDDDDDEHIDKTPADLNFTCPNCRQRIEAGDELMGENIQCPSCNTMIKITSYSFGWYNWRSY